MTVSTTCVRCCMYSSYCYAYRSIEVLFNVTVAKHFFLLNYSSATLPARNASTNDRDRDETLVGLRRLETSRPRPHS